MRVAIVTFDGFNELDSFVALGLINQFGHQRVIELRPPLCQGTRAAFMRQGFLPLTGYRRVRTPVFRPHGAGGWRQSL